MRKELRKYIPSEIIVDGKVVSKNLPELGINMDWLEKQLEAQSVSRVKNVLYAELQSDGSLYIQKKSKS